MSIQALREQLNASNKAARHLLAEKGSAIWSKDDQDKFDNHMEEADRIKHQIDAHERMIAADVERNFTDAERLPGKQKMSDAQRGFDIFLRKKPEDMNNEERLLVRNVMSTTTAAQGGNTVQSEVASQLIEFFKLYGYVRKAASQLVTAMGNNLSFPTSDGTSETGEWIAQNVTATALDPSFGTVALNTFKASSKIIAVPFELLQDSQIDMQKFVMNRMAMRIGRISNLGFTTGAGTTDPFGIVTQAGSGKVGTTGQTLTIIYDDLVDLVDSLDAAYLEYGPATPVDATAGPLGAAPGPSFMMSQAMRRVVRKLKDTAGRPLWMPSYDLGITKHAPDELMGYPVFLNNDMAAPGVSAKSLIFGNLQLYLIRDVMEVTMFRFEDSNYARLGQVGFLAWARVGGNLLDANGVKFYQHSAT